MEGDHNLLEREPQRDEGEMDSSVGIDPSGVGVRDSLTSSRLEYKTENIKQ